jgi:hypothetical protein
MRTFEDFQEAIDNCISSGFFYPHPLLVKSNNRNRKTLLDIAKAFEAHYGFELLDMEIDLIWKWFGDNYDSLSFPWMALSEKCMSCFEVFVDTFGKNCNTEKRL